MTRDSVLSIRAKATGTQLEVASINNENEQLRRLLVPARLLGRSRLLRGVVEVDDHPEAVLAREREVRHPVAPRFERENDVLVSH